MPAPKLNTLVAHPARRYNYWLGGKDNFAADRESGDHVAALYPSVRTAALENRQFLKRSVQFLAGECGVRQFLDIGTGLPAPDNTHEVAQAIAPESRVVYVDNDALVMVHARALLTGTLEGRTAYVEQDLRSPKAILTEAQRTLDFDRPIAVLLVAVVHFVPDADRPADVISEFFEAMPAGSYCVLSHATADPVDDMTRARWDRLAASGQHGAFQYRSRDEIQRLLGNWDVVEPGLVPVAEWRPEPDRKPVAFQEAAVYAVVTRKA